MDSRCRDTHDVRKPARTQGLGTAHRGGSWQMSTHSLRSIPRPPANKDAACAGWHNGDYLEAVDKIIPVLCEDLGCYASVCGVERSVLLKDVMASILLDSPNIVLGDEDYLQCIVAIRGWLLEDIDAVSRAFEVQFRVVLVDVLRVIIEDTALADPFVRDLASRIVSKDDANPFGAPC